MNSSCSFILCLFVFLQLCKLAYLFQGVFLKFRPQRLKYFQGFVQFFIFCPFGIKHFAFPCLHPSLVHTVQLANVAKQKLFFFNAAVFQVAYNITAYAEPFPELTLG